MPDDEVTSRLARMEERLARIEAALDTSALAPPSQQWPLWDCGHVHPNRREAVACREAQKKAG